MTSTLDQLVHDRRQRQQLLHQGIVLGGGILGGVAARRLLSTLWRRSRAAGSPPLTPGEAGVSWQRATVWALSSGVAAGVSRMLARRLATRAVGPARSA